MKCGSADPMQFWCEHRRSGCFGKCTYCGRFTNHWPWGTNNLACCSDCWNDLVEESECGLAYMQ